MCEPYCPTILNPRPIWIRRRIKAIRATRSIRVVDRILRIRRAIPAEAVCRRVRIERVGAQLAAVISLLVIEAGRLDGEGTRRGCIAERAAVGAEGIVDAV